MPGKSSKAKKNQRSRRAQKNNPPVSFATAASFQTAVLHRPVAHPSFPSTHSSAANTSNAIQDSKHSTASATSSAAATATAKPPSFSAGALTSSNKDTKWVTPARVSSLPTNPMAALPLSAIMADMAAQKQSLSSFNTAASQLHLAAPQSNSTATSLPRDDRERDTKHSGNKTDSEMALSFTNTTAANTAASANSGIPAPSKFNAGQDNKDGKEKIEVESSLSEAKRLKDLQNFACECLICTDDITALKAKNAKLLVLSSCGHSYCNVCIQNPDICRCPVCRKEILEGYSDIIGNAESTEEEIANAKANLVLEKNKLPLNEGLQHAYEIIASFKKESSKKGCASDVNFNTTYQYLKNIGVFQTNLETINYGLMDLITKCTPENLKKWTTIDSKDLKESQDTKTMKEIISSNIKQFIVVPLQTLNRLPLNEDWMVTDLSILVSHETTKQLVNDIITSWNKIFNSIISNVEILRKTLNDISEKYLSVRAALRTMQRIAEKQTFIRQFGPQLTAISPHNGTPKVKTNDEGSENRTITAATPIIPTTSFTPSYHANRSATASTTTAAVVRVDCKHSIH